MLSNLSQVMCPSHTTVSFPGGSVVKNLPASAGEAGLIPWLGKLPVVGNGNPPQYSCLKDAMDSGTWWATVHGVTESQTWLAHMHHASQTFTASLKPYQVPIPYFFLLSSNWWLPLLPRLYLIPGVSEGFICLSMVNQSHLTFLPLSSMAWIALDIWHLCQFKQGLYLLHKVGYSSVWCIIIEYLLCKGCFKHWREKGE